jgi:hypothetical protein
MEQSCGNMLKASILAALSLGLPSPLLAQAAFHYECKGDSSVGYRFDEGVLSWKSGEFRVGEPSYSVRHLTDEEMRDDVIYKGKTWGVFAPHDKATLLSCPDMEAGDLRCGGGSLSFILDSHSLRYQKYYQGGYVSGRDDNDDTPFIEIGRCRLVSGA